jgi:hypothetical protein
LDELVVARKGLIVLHEMVSVMLSQDRWEKRTNVEKRIPNIVMCDGNFGTRHLQTR